MLTQTEILKIITGGHSPPVQRNNDLFCQGIIKLHTMKKIKIAISFVSIYCLFCFAKCKKDNPDNNGLPAATQEGKNTLGFLLNGQPWKPQGVRGTGNLSIDFDPAFNQGVFNIVAYNFVPSISEQFIIGVKDSLNFINAPANFNLRNNSLLGVAYTNSNCSIFSNEASTLVSGNLSLTKLDRTNRIIAGTFSFTLNKTGCSEIRITDGRFDMKF